MAEPKLRFKRDDGSNYPSIEPKLLNEFLTVNSDRNKLHEYDKKDVLSVSGDFGVVNQIKFQGRSFAGEDVGNYHILYNGDIVYTKSPLKENPYGIIKFNNGPTGIVSTLYAVYHCNDNVDGRAVQYYFDLKSRLNKYLKPLVNIGAKHDMKISAEKAISDYVMLPCLEEQQKIADFLSSVDEVISASEQEVVNLEIQKKAVMKKIFSQEVRFKKDDGSDFPEWEEKTTEKVLQTITDYVAAGSFADIAKNVKYQSEGYAQLVRTVDLKNHFTSKEEVFVSESAFNYLWRVNLDKECIIMPNVGNCGEIYYVTPSIFPHEHNVLGPNAIVVRSECVNNRFIACLMESDGFQEQLRLIVNPSGQSKFNKTEFKRLFLQIPCLEEQQRIAELFSNFDEAIASAKKELELWKELKKGLLQQMFV